MASPTRLLYHHICSPSKKTRLDATSPSFIELFGFAAAEHFEPHIEADESDAATHDADKCLSVSVTDEAAGGYR